MLFNSYAFILLFLPLVLLGYYGLGKLKKGKFQLLYLTAVSFWFCGFQNPFFLVVLTGSLLFNYGICCLICRLKTQGKRKFCLIAGVFLNIGTLLYFKYYNFFVENINFLLGSELRLLEILLPLGISFYTFQQIAFLADNYRGECRCGSFPEYAAYISFFPKLIQGPIMYYNEFVIQAQAPEAVRPDFVNLSKGLYSFALGLGKKVLIADTLARIVNAGYSNIEVLNSCDAVLVMLCYSLQIYFDFSGYCDMAQGVAYALNIKLPLNFNSPYKALSISDFWNRWHMTLTRFFTKYVYIPLGGSRRGKMRTNLNILIVFLISGLWHGANWTFVLWGLLNGLIKVFEKTLRVEEWRLPRPVKRITAFSITTLAWSIFRADSLMQVKALWTRLFTAGPGRLSWQITSAFNDIMEMIILRRLGLGGIVERYPGLVLAAFVILLILACFTLKNTQEKTEQMRYTPGRMVLVLTIMVWSIMSLSEITKFIYFNF